MKIPKKNKKTKKQNLWTLATLVSVLTDRKIVFHLFASHHSFPCSLLNFIQVMGKSACLRAKLLQSCATLCDPIDCSPPGSSIHGILQAGILEWAAMASSRGSSQPRDRIHIFCVSCIAGRFFISQATKGSPSGEENDQVLVNG